MTFKIKFLNLNLKDHFKILQNGNIKPVSAIGKATIKIRNLNHPDSILERSIMLEKGIF